MEKKWILSNETLLGENDFMGAMCIINQAFHPLL